ncbi:MAG: hypothetical protein ACTSRP_28555, partial [Candidatus Helarchaeota archaeon]
KTYYPTSSFLYDGFLFVSDSQYLYQFIAPPEQPNLFPITPNITNNGLVKIHWESVGGIEYYKIYRSKNPNFDFHDLEPIAITTNNTFIDKVSSEGLFYYGIVAHNIWGDSQISEIQSIQSNYEEKNNNNFNWLFILLILLIVGIVGSIALNLRYHFILKNKNISNKSKSDNWERTLIKKMEKALKGVEKKNQIIRNFKKLLHKEPENIRNL